MKVLQIINSLSTGGAEKLVLETTPLFVEKGIETDVLVLDGTRYPYMKELENLQCCTIYTIGKNTIYNPLLIFKIIPYLKKYDLIHVHLFPSQYWVVMAKILSFSKTKLVFTEHSTSNRRIQNNKFKYIERFVYSHYDKIICISKNVEEIFFAYTGLHKKKFQIIENGINLLKIKEAQSIDKNSIDLSLSEFDKLIIQIAGFRIEKDQKTVIRALTHLQSNVKLLLVGDGELINECKNLVLELGLSNRVFFLGTRTDVPSLLKIADVSIVSSHWEGFGLVAVESMASGKPIIASNVEGLSNVVAGAGILFEKGNDMELASKIEKVLNDDILYKELVSLGLKRSEKYDITNMVDSHINMYKNLLE